jgi:transposase
MVICYNIINGGVFMRLKISASKNSKSYYVIKSVYKNGHSTTKVVERLGTYEELKEKLNGEDPEKWARAYIAELNQKEKEDNTEVLVKYSTSKNIKKDEQRSFNGGYLFLEKIYHELKLDKICNDISKKYKFTYNINAILSRLLYSRILYPLSKKATFEISKTFIEQPKFELHHIYRALEVFAKETDFIQSSLYKNSLNISNRNTNVLYYDCTNYFFEIENEEGLKQYGVSKEHRPNPIVQMGLFMDGDGIPLAFNINAGNTNEQVTMKPLESQIMKDFDLSKFVVCTDAGLSSINNRKFNNIGDRAFVTTQSIKKLKSHLKEWALDTKGWNCCDNHEDIDISNLDEQTDINRTFFKERWINENGLEQKLIITYSLKYKKYQKKIREKQVQKALKTLDSSKNKIGKVNQNNYKRFIKESRCTNDGEVAENKSFSIDMEKISNEAVYDGFYAVCTNLDDSAVEISKINKRRWQIEECFRIMKSEFKARPVYLSVDERIKAHFTTCFIALILYRFLEKKLDEKYTCSEIISGLKDMNFFEVNGNDLVPTYKRTDFTDDLHEKFGFRTDYEILTHKKIKKILKEVKS